MAEVTDILEFDDIGVGLSDRTGWTGFNYWERFFDYGLTDFDDEDAGLPLDSNNLTYLVPLEFMK